MLGPANLVAGCMIDCEHRALGMNKRRLSFAHGVCATLRVRPVLSSRTLFSPIELAR